MKKMTFALVVMLVAAFTGTASATKIHIDHNPNSFELDMNCDGQTVHTTIPVITAAAGQVAGGGLAIAFTHYIDFDGDGFFEPDELVASILHGQGVQTTWCTWRWDRDPFLHGMDIQFISTR